MKFNLSIIKLLICSTVISTTFSSCNEDDFFLLPDRQGIDAAIWDSEGSVQMHLNRAYDNIIPTFVYDKIPSDRGGMHLASDESMFPHASDAWTRRVLGIEVGYILGNNDIRFVGNKYSPNRGENKYFDIARCNNAIKFIPEGNMPEVQKNTFLGQYHTLRAMVYFDLAKVYGGVPLILEPVDPDNIDVSGRNSAKEIFDAVISDLDMAIQLLDGVTWSDGDGRGKINKEIATVLKAKVLMYWASPQFNPKDDPKHPFEAERWQRALDANKTAYDLCVASGRRLVDDYAEIFRLEGTANPEAILVRTQSSTVERRGHDVEYLSRPTSEQGNAYWGFVPTVKLLETYRMKDGNPTGEGAYDYDNVLFWKNRDPRFEATIAYLGSNWPLSGKPDRRQWTYVSAPPEGNNVRGAYCKRYTTPDLPTGGVRYQSNIGGNGMDWIELRFAEVILNYAECLNETGNLAEAKTKVRMIRDRAGIDEGGNGNDYGLGAVAGQDQMRDLIMDERMVEFAFENKRHADLRRTRRMHLLEGNMQTVRIEPLNDAAKKALETVDPNTGQMVREGLNLNDRTVYTTYFKTWQPQNVNDDYGSYSVPEHYYFFTFHNDFTNRGVDIQPTIGWAGGTFDPLEN